MLFPIPLFLCSWYFFFLINNVGVVNVNAAAPLSLGRDVLSMDWPREKNEGRRGVTANTGSKICLYTYICIFM